MAKKAKKEKEMLGLMETTPAEEIEVVGPESFIVDAAAPLLNIVAQFEAMHHSVHLSDARMHINQAIEKLNTVYSSLR